MENMNQVVNGNTPEVENKEIVDTQENKTEQDVKTFTQDELDKIIKSNVDRALAKAKAEAEEKQEEAKKLAKMNAEEKANYELKQKEEKLRLREAEITKRELTAEAKNILTERGLPSDLHTLLNYESADTVQESIKVLESAIQKATERAVDERLRGETPRKSISPGQMTKEEILNISNPSERYKKIAENINLFE